MDKTNHFKVRIVPVEGELNQHPNNFVEQNAERRTMAQWLLRDLPIGLAEFSLVRGIV